MAIYHKLLLFRPYQSLSTCLLSRQANCLSGFHSSRSLMRQLVDEDATTTTLMTDQTGVNDEQQSKLLADQTVIDEIYKKGNENKRDGRKRVKKIKPEDYFKLAWQKHAAENEVISSFGQSQDRKESSNSGEMAVTTGSENSSKREIDIDYRLRNERIAAEVPEDQDEERDWRKNIPLTPYGRWGNKVHYYNRKMIRFGREGRVNEAMQVFDDWMMTMDRVRPNLTTFVILTDIVGNAGYTRKAFELLRQMKHMGIEPRDQNYTILFNACANCPEPAYGLRRAHSLYQELRDKGIALHPITVLAAMKAFAHCGDFPMAFKILDESSFRLNSQCFNALLVACVSDKESGFRRALKVWQKMKEMKIRPEIRTYNLLLRCIRDCGVGDVNTLAEDFGLNQKLSSPSTPDDRDENNTNALQALGETGNQKNVDEFRKDNNSHLQQGIDPNHKSISRESSGLSGPRPSPKDFPQSQDTRSNTALNILNHFPETKSHSPSRIPSQGTSKQSSSLELVEKPKSKVKPLGGETILDKQKSISFTEKVSLSELVTRPGKLALVGGAEGLLSNMRQQEVEPNIQTFTQFLSCLPNDADSDAFILKAAEESNVDIDIDFLNDILVRRRKRYESDNLEDIFQKITELRLTPNMRTYGALASTCHNLQLAEDLIRDMEAANIEPSTEIMGHFIAASRFNFYYKFRLLEKMEQLCLKPTAKIIGAIEKTIAMTKQNIVAAERNRDKTSKLLNPRFQRNFQKFLSFYKSWLLRSELKKERHPWERFTDPGALREAKKLEKDIQSPSTKNSDR